MLLTVKIDGDWTARELAEVLDSLEAFATFIVDGRIIRMGLQPPNVQPGDGSVTIAPGPPLAGHLRLFRFTYASPGSFDLLGVAKIVEQIRIFLQHLIDLWVTKNDRKLDRENRHLELIERKVEVLAKIRERQPDLAEFVENEASDPLISAVLQGQITGVSSRNSDDN